MGELIANVKGVYQDYCDALGGRKNTAHEGRTEACLVIEHHIRVLREVEGTSLTALGKEESIAALEAVLRAINGREFVERLYDELNNWRRIRFIPESGSAIDPMADDASSVSASPEETPLLPPGNDPQEYEDLRSRPSASQEGQAT